METIPILENGRQVSHLAVRFDTPAQGGRPDLAFLYLHGLGSSQDGEKADFFRGRTLESGFAFCSFDFQGHGDSGGCMRSLSLTRNLQDVACVHGLLRKRGYERICLLGSSMGGGTALWYSALHPEGIVAGLHIAPALELERGLVAWAGPDRCRTWEETGTILYESALVTCELGWELIVDLRSYPFEALLDRYRTPALLLQGRRDTSVPWRGVADFATRCPFPDIELHLFADGDHRLTDRKDRLWELMMEFLRGRRLV